MPYFAMIGQKTDKTTEKIDSERHEESAYSRTTWIYGITTGKYYQNNRAWHFIDYKYTASQQQANQLVWLQSPIELGVFSIQWTTEMQTSSTSTYVLEPKKLNTMPGYQQEANNLTFVR
jgi:hypothetical protein